MRLFISLLSILILAVACGKDKFTTIPQITIESINPKTVFHGDILQLESKFTDDEGDLDSVLVVYKWYNAAAVVRKDTFRYTFDTFLPAKTRQGDLIVTFEYNTANQPGLVTLPAVGKDTTATFGLILIDKAANRSTYAESEQIRLKKP